MVAARRSMEQVCGKPQINSKLFNGLLDPGPLSSKKRIRIRIKDWIRISTY
jgi:hypothetical protein